MSHSPGLPSHGFMIIPLVTFLSVTESLKSCMWKLVPCCAFDKPTDKKWEVKITQEPLYFIEVRWPQQVKVNTFPCKYIFPVLP